MATRNVQFTFSPDPATLSVLDHMTLTIRDSAQNLVAAAVQGKADTAYATALDVGATYTATLTAYSATNQPDANPPSQTFTVPAPPVTIPGDPTLDPPTFN